MFEERYERKNISSENQLRQLIVYINRNPEHHRIVKRFQEYQWTSYHEIVGDFMSVIEKEKILQLFDSLETFQLAMHKTDFEEWLKTEE